MTETRSNGWTPGPWSQHPHFPEYVVPSGHADRPIGFASDPAFDLAHYAQHIVMLRPAESRRSAAENAANARLIAAAPDLHDALSNAAEFLHFYFTGPDADRNRATEKAENLLAEAIAAFEVARAALARTSGEKG